MSNSKDAANSAKRFNVSPKDAEIHIPVLTVIQKHKVVRAEALGYILQISGAFGKNPARKFRPSEVQKWARRMGLNYVGTVPQYVSTVKGAAATNMVHNMRHEAAVCAIELALRFGAADVEIIEFNERREKDEKLADLYALVPSSGVIRAIEVELTQKSQGRLTGVIDGHEQKVKHAEYDEVMYLTASAGISAAVKRAHEAQQAKFILAALDINDFFQNLVRASGCNIEGAVA